MEEEHANHEHSNNRHDGPYEVYSSNAVILEDTRKKDHNGKVTNNPQCQKLRMQADGVFLEEPLSGCFGDDDEGDKEEFHYLLL